jgi:putative endonuclease
MFRWLQRLFFRRDSAPPSRGEIGERLAEDFLRRERGYTVVAANWRLPRDRRAELDLVCRDGDVLVFVEVKTRLTGALVPGFYAVDARKKRALLRACSAYLRQLRPPPQTYRFDIVEVGLPADGEGASTPPAINHFQNISLFPKHRRG